MTPPVRVVTGYFDVLLPGHVRRLRDLRAGAGTLIALVRDPPRPLLSSHARCEMVAALEMIDYVVQAGIDDIPGLLTDLAGSEVIREEAADERRATELMRHVRRRHEIGNQR